MSQAVCKRHVYDEQQEAELARWPGVTWGREVRGKHYALVLTFDGASRFVVYPSSPGDVMRGGLNHLTDARVALRAIGAVRTSQKRQGPKVARRRTRVEESFRLARLEPITGGPERDPWAELRTIDLTPPEPPTPPPTPCFWSRLLAWFRPSDRTAASDATAKPGKTGRTR